MITNLVDVDEYVVIYISVSFVDENHGRKPREKELERIKRHQ